MAFAKKYNIKEILKIATMWRFPLGLFLILSLSACQQEKGRHFSAPFVEASTVHAANVPINFDYAANIEITKLKKKTNLIRPSFLFLV